jgi:NAD+-dependent farnesol dehydrogenase
MKIFLTGGTGYLGYQLLQRLSANGHEITALVRSQKSASNFPLEVKPVHGRIEDPETYKRALDGQDAFVHIAALVKMWVRDRKQFDRVNVEALENAIRNAREAGIAKFVYSSSFIALGPSNGWPINESDSRRTDHYHNDYERTKFLADQLARRYVEEGYPLYILYPGVIYGPGNLTAGNIIAKNMIPFLNGWMPFGLSIKDWTYSYIDDVVRGFVSVIENQPPSHRYILGGENHSGASFYQTLSEVTGKKPPKFNLPLKMAAVAGYGEYLLATLFGREPSLLTHEVVRIYEHSWSYDSTLAEKELGYRITPLKDGLRAMVTWLKEARYVRS